MFTFVIKRLTGHVRFDGARNAFLNCFIVGFYDVNGFRVTKRGIWGVFCSTAVVDYRPSVGILARIFS